MMKYRLLSILIIGLLAYSLCSCENFHENNGALGGMWQLSEWRTESQTGEVDSIKATKADGIYYSIHRNIIQFSKILPNEQLLYQGYSQRFYAILQRSKDNLYLQNFIDDKTDLPVEMSKRMEFAIPEDSTYHIDCLTEDALVLSYPGNKLFFRKY